MDIPVTRDLPAIPQGTPNPTSPLPRLNRVWLIAMRDFVGYLKTWGFWLSFLFPVIGAVLGLVLVSADIDLSPPKYETIIDETDYHAERLLEYQDERYENRRAVAVQALGRFLPKDEREEFKAYTDENGADAGLAELKRRGAVGSEQVSIPEPDMIFIDPPAPTLDALRPYLTGERTITVDGAQQALNGVVVIKGTRDDMRAEYWTRNFNNAPAERLLNDYRRRLAQSEFLEAAGLSREDYLAVTEDLGSVRVFDPAKATGAAGAEEDEAVSAWDRLPFFAGAGLGFFLLMTIFAGSVALLTSMIEEKMNKLLEMMLASAKFSEIMLGKMLGAALLTLASLLPYILLGVVALVGFLLFGNAEQIGAIRDAFPLSTVLLSVTYLVLGYMFYATILISLGALAQSMQDAQTLSVPMVMVMFLGIVVIQVGLAAPDSPPIVFASIFPLTSPFAMMIRLANDPPLWQVALSLVLLFASVVGVMWLCARIFRFGVLSGAGMSAMKGWFRRTVLRRAA